MIKKVKKNGLTNFITQTLIDSPNSNTYTPLQLAKKLATFHNVGKTVYGRQNSSLIENRHDAEITILQLIVSNILRLSVKEGSKPVAYCKLGIENNTPNYMNNDYWQNFYLIE